MALWDQWQTIGIAIVSLMFTLVGLVYAIGIGFGLPKVKAWAHNEFYQVVASAIILGGVAILLPSMNGMVNSIVGSCDHGDLWGLVGEHCSVDCDTVPNIGPCDPKEEGCCSRTVGGALGLQKGNNYMCLPGCPGYNAAFDIALAFLEDMRDRLTLMMTGLSVSSLFIGMMISFKYSLASSQQGFGFAVAPGMFPIMDLLSILGMGIGAGMGMFWAQIFVLSFIRIKLITMLPIGIALRAFPYTRGAGAAIIALVVGLYVVYPLMVVLESRLVYDSLDAMGEPDPTGNLAEKLMDLNIFEALGGIIDRIIYIVLIAGVFLPLFNLTVTFAFMKDLARLMGGEIDVSSLAKLL